MNKYQAKIKKLYEKKGRRICSPTTMCRPMEVYSQGNARKKGIVSLNFADVTTGKPTRPPVVVYKGNASDPGVVFNCCPWCKEDIAHG